MSEGSQQQLDHARLRELGRTTETAPLGVKRASKGFITTLQQGWGKGPVRRWFLSQLDPNPCATTDRFRQVAGVALNIGPSLAPDLGHPLQQVHERGPWKVGAAEERPAVGRQEHSHGPTALAGDGLNRLHVNGVDVRSLLAVDLDVDEQFVHHGRDSGVLE
jgi:hypothetical protein